MSLVLRTANPYSKTAEVGDMAKQLVGPAERHLDKAILGLACLALVWVVIRYGVSSPNRIDLDGEMVSPSNIDQS